MNGTYSYNPSSYCCSGISSSVFFPQKIFFTRKNPYISISITLPLPLLVSLTHFLSLSLVLRFRVFLQEAKQLGESFHSKSFHFKPFFSGLKTWKGRVQNCHAHLALQTHLYIHTHSTHVFPSSCLFFLYNFNIFQLSPFCSFPF